MKSARYVVLVSYLYKYRLPFYAIRSSSNLSFQLMTFAVAIAYPYPQGSPSDSTASGAVDDKKVDGRFFGGYNGYNSYGGYNTYGAGLGGYSNYQGYEQYQGYDGFGGYNRKRNNSHLPQCHPTKIFNNYKFIILQNNFQYRILVIWRLLWSWLARKTETIRCKSIYRWSWNGCIRGSSIMSIFLHVRTTHRPQFKFRILRYILKQLSETSLLIRTHHQNAVVKWIRSLCNKVQIIQMKINQCTKYF